MSPEATFFCYLVALVAFVLAAANVPIPRLGLLGLGLAAWLFPTFWNAMEAL